MIDLRPRRNGSGRLSALIMRCTHVHIRGRISRSGSGYERSGASMLTAITINCIICNNPGKLIAFSEVQLQIIAFSSLQLELIVNLYSQFELIRHPEKKNECQ